MSILILRFYKPRSSIGGDFNIFFLAGNECTHQNNLGGTSSHQLIFPDVETPTWGGEFLIFPGVPTNSPQVLKIHCGTGEVDLIGPVFQGDWNLRFR